MEDPPVGLCPQPLFQPVVGCVWLNSAALLMLTLHTHHSGLPPLANAALMLAFATVGFALGADFRRSQPTDPLAGGLATDGMPGPLVIGVALAACSAVATDLSFLLKHRGARAAAPVDIRRPLRSVRSLFGSGFFAIGFTVALGAGAFHIGALALAPLSLVQTVIAAGIVLLAVLAQRLFAHTVTLRQWIGLVLAACGLTMLALVFPAAHASHAFSGQGLVAFTVALVGGAVLLLVAARRWTRHRGVVLGSVSGLFFGLADISIKAAADTFSTHRGLSLALALVAVVAAAEFAAQFANARGLQLGDAVPVTALTMTTATVTAIAAGLVAFHDPLPRGVLPLAVESVGFALVVTASLLTPIRVAEPEPLPASASQSRRLRGHGLSQRLIAWVAAVLP